MLAATFLAVFLVPLFFKLVNDGHFRSDPADFARLKPGALDRSPHAPAPTTGTETGHA
jgi:hypothetical protein